MSNCSIIAVILLVAFTTLVAAPVYAEDAGSIQYSAGVYTVTSNYTLTKVDQPPAYVSAAKTVDGINILDQTVPPLHFDRFGLVSKPGSGIDASFVLTSPGVKYESDLEGARVTVNNVPVMDGTIIANKGLVRVQGNIPYNAVPDQDFKIIRIADLSPNENAKFLVYTTTDEIAAAKNAIYLLNEKVVKNGAESFKPDLQAAVDNYKNGKFTQATIIAEAALQKDTIRGEGISTALLPALILALALAALGFYLGMVYGKKKANKPDLLKIEQVVLKYYGTRSEKPFSPVKLSRECEVVLERAFDFNANRAELLRKQKDLAGSGVDPDRISGPGMRPSLFQALYEKTIYGKCQAFDAGIVYLNKNLGEKEPKR